MSDINDSVLKAVKKSLERLNAEKAMVEAQIQESEKELSTCQIRLASITEEKWNLERWVDKHYE